jgi:hypothetical protein
MPKGDIKMNNIDSIRNELDMLTKIIVATVHVEQKLMWRKI